MLIKYVHKNNLKEKQISKLHCISTVFNELCLQQGIVYVIKINQFIYRLQLQTIIAQLHKIC